MKKTKEKVETVVLTEGSSEEKGKVLIYVEKGHKQVLEKAVENNLPVLLIGDTGCGKTTFVRDLAQRKGIELFRLNLTGQTGVDEFLGKWLASPEKGTYWLDGLLIRAMKEGKWIVLDEINMALPEILSALHSLLDDDKKVVMKEFDGSVIRPHKDFRLFATMNPEDEYAGTKELNKAFLSRFPVVMNIDYSPNEEQIVKEQGNVDEVTAKSLVMVGREIRSAKKKNLITYTCSTRDLIYCASLMALDLEKSLSFEMAVLNKVPKDERESIQKIIELVTGEKIVTKTHTFKTLEEMIESFNKISEKDREHEEEVKKLNKIIKDQDNAYQAKEKEAAKFQVALRETVDMLGKEREAHQNTKLKAKRLIKTFEELTSGLSDEEKSVVTKSIEPETPDTEVAPF